MLLLICKNKNLVICLYICNSSIHFQDEILLLDSVYIPDRVQFLPCSRKMILKDESWCKDGFCLMFLSKSCMNFVEHESFDTDVSSLLPLRER